MEPLANFICGLWVFGRLAFNYQSFDDCEVIFRYIQFDALL